MLPPSRIAIARPIAGSPLTRNIGCGGSARPRRTVAISRSRIRRPFTTKVTFSRSFSEFERACCSKRESLVSRLNGPGRNDDVLRFERGGQRGPVDAQSRKLLSRKLDEDFLILLAEELNLRYVGHLQQFRANILDVIAKLTMTEPVRGEAVDNSVGIAELIVEARADNAGRQGVAHIGHAFADVVPDVRDFRGGRLALQRDENRGAPRFRITLDVIEARRFLKRPLKALGDLLQRLIQVRARPARKDDHGAEGKGRILVAAQAEVGQRASKHERDHAVNRERPMRERPLREIELHQEEVPSSRTLRPGYSA